MTDLATPSPEELSSRRRALRKQRRLRNLQNIWRVLAIAGLAGGALWLLRNPIWLTLRGNQQVIIEGNEMLADATIQELMALEYPQPLLAIEPDEVEQHLRTQSPIALVHVERRLFPPRLVVTLQERQPVAVTVPSVPGVAEAVEKTPANHPGLVDIEGYWMPYDERMRLNREFTLPKLRVRGFHERYQPQWPALYEALQNSPVNVTEVDWRSPSNLILQTELGTIHLGVYAPLRLQKQLAMLPSFRSLTTNPDMPEIDFVDLSNPQTPAVKLSNVPNPEPVTP